MSKVIFNNLINLEYPDGFVELNEVENKKYFNGDLLRLSFHHKEKHILLSLSKTKKSFINRIVSISAVANNLLSNMMNSLKDYEDIEEYKDTIFNEPAITKCFSYTANDKDIKQYCELSIFKLKNAFYFVYCLSRFEDKEEHKELFKKFRDSFTK